MEGGILDLKAEFFQELVFPAIQELDLLLEMEDLRLRVLKPAKRRQLVLRILSCEACSLPGEA